MRWLLDILFGKKEPKSVWVEYPPKCKHGDVEWRSVEPVTMLPRRGKCRNCGKTVKARIVWENDE